MTGSACTAVIASHRSATPRQAIRRGINRKTPAARPLGTKGTAEDALRGNASVNNDATDGFARMHKIEPLVDLVEGELMGDQIIDIYFAFHVPIDDFRHVGTAASATKGGSFPDPSGDELEGSGRDFLAGAGDPDDDTDAPAAMGTFERLPHDIDVADALEAVVGAPIGQVHEMRDEVTLHLLRVDEMSHPELLGHRAPLRVEVDANDHVRPGHLTS